RFASDTRASSSIFPLGTEFASASIGHPETRPFRRSVMRASRSKMYRFPRAAKCTSRSIKPLQRMKTALAYTRVQSGFLRSHRRLPLLVDNRNWTFLAGFEAGGKSDEEEPVHRVADRGDSQRRGSGGSGGAVGAQARHQRGDLLPLEVEV